MTKQSSRETPAHIIHVACGPVNKTVVEAEQRLAQHPTIGTQAHKRQLREVVPVPQLVVPHR